MQPVEARKLFRAVIRLPHGTPVQVAVHQGQHLGDLVSHVIHTNGLPSYLAVPIQSCFRTAFREHSKHTMRQSLKTAKDRQQRRNDFLTRYQANTLQYHNKPEEDVFPRAYHTLVHCQIEAMFNTLLSLEQDYASVIQERYMAYEKELADLQERQSRETEFSPGSPQVNMTHLFSRQVEEREVFQATWESEILQTQETQRREYRAFVIELYREYQQRLGLLPDNNTEETLNEAEKKLDGKEIVKAAADRIQQSLDKTKKRSGSTSSNATDDQSSSNRRRQSSSASMFSQLSSSSSDAKEKAAFQKMVSDIQEMGFAREQAETALALTNHSMEQAVMMLLEDPSKVNAAMQQRSSTQFKRSSSLGQLTSPAHSRNNSWNDASSTLSSRRHSLQRLSAYISPPVPISKPPSNSKSWSPLSFLQQQKQVMENTNLSSVRKLGGWLGRAIENLGIEHEGDPRLGSTSNAAGVSHTHPAPQPVESFTISLGTAQIRSTHNLRLLVADTAADIFNPMPYDPTREMAYKAQTATKLYTSHISAIIVLVELSELNRSRDHQGSAYGWRQYRTGKGSNKALFDRCRHSTEFHFPDIESQLTVIESDFASRPDGLQEGNFFVTRHSNLPLTQVVFHLIIDSDGITTTELSSRHSLVNGLRNILRLATRFDISSLSIPLLLLPDRYLEQPEHHFSAAYLDQPPQHFAWLQKRGEVVMKCVKGFLTENSRSGKRVQGESADRAETVYGGGLRNLEFLLPSSSNVYGQAPDQNQDVEFAFQQFRSSLVNLFRTS